MCLKFVKWHLYYVGYIAWKGRADALVNKEVGCMWKEEADTVTGFESRGRGNTTRNRMAGLPAENAKKACLLVNFTFVILELSCPVHFFLVSAP
jgi:hypothetical protein